MSTPKDLPRRAWTMWVLMCVLAGGCQGIKLDEIRGKSSAGPEFRDRGDHSDEVRWDARQGIDFRWSNGWTTGVGYRYRAVDDGNGDQEHLVFAEVGYPLWKAKKAPDKNAERIQALEEEVKKLRQQQSPAQELDQAAGEAGGAQPAAAPAADDPAPGVESHPGN